MHPCVRASMCPCIHVSVPSCVPREPLAGQGDRSAPQTQAGTPTGRVWEESYAGRHGKVGMRKEQSCGYLGSRNAHTRHA